MGPRRADSVSHEFARALATAHRSGHHATAEGELDPSGYWRDAGCPLCADAEAFDRDLDLPQYFHVKDRVELISVAATLVTLTEVNDPRRVWTALIFKYRGDQDRVVAPNGQILLANYRLGEKCVPAGVWGALAKELT